jgi:hypothetical protein
MSNLVYPSLPGLAFPVARVSNWGTRMQRAVSGRTLRLRDYANPIWNWTLTYTGLEDNPSGAAPLTSAPNAWRILMDFFNSRAGASDDFLFLDPQDYQAVGQVAVPVPGDTTGQLFQLTRALVAGGFQEWISGIASVSAVYFYGSLQSPGSYQLGFNQILFNNAVGGGITVTADFTFLFRVYFTDRLDPSRFQFKLAELKQVKLTSEVA